MIPMNDLAAHHGSIRGELDAAIAQVMDHGRFVNGPEVASFERRFADYCSSAECVGVSSGTSALEIGLRAAGVGPGQEVITSTFTFFATVEAIVNVGATPVLVDVDPESALMTVDSTAAAIGERTAAIIVVHLYGQPVDLRAFRELADGRKVRLIEDAAQAHGAAADGLRAGSVGDFAAFSFFPGKNLGALGDAGAITTNDDEIAEQARLLRDHGRTTRYEYAQVGTNARLDTIQAALLEVKLKHLDRWTSERSHHAAAYDEAFAKSNVARPIKMMPGRKSAHHLYTLRCADRDAVVGRLTEREIASAVHYPIPLHQQPALRRAFSGIDLPNSELLSGQVLSIPLYPELQDEQRARVIEAVSGQGP